MWGTASTTCPAPVLPPPIVTACRSAAGIEVSWSVPTGVWASGTGWIVEVNEQDQFGQIGSHMIGYGNSEANPLPWRDRSVTIAVPAGQGVQITVVSYDEGPPKHWGTYASHTRDAAPAQPEPGCGGSTAPAPPGPLADPSPTLTCGPRWFVGGFASWADGAPADWERNARYEVEYEDTNSAWQSVAIVVHGSGELRFSGPSDPGNAVDIRVRGRGRHREQTAGTWSPWSDWSAWSSWHNHATPVCIGVPPPPTASAPTSLALACTASGSTLTAQAIWTASADTATVQYRHTATWVVTPSGGTSATHTTGPHTTLNAAITNISHSLAAGDTGQCLGDHPSTGTHPHQRFHLHGMVRMGHSISCSRPRAGFRMPDAGNPSSTRRRHAAPTRR